LVPSHFLKKDIASAVFKSALKTGLLVISTSANSTKKLRKNLVALARRDNRKTIMIYFNLPEKLLLDRIDKGNKSKKCLYHSKNFKDLLLNKQSIRFEGANKNEADYFFEVNNLTEINKTYGEVLNIIKK